MHLEHVNLVVADLEATLDFYRAAFPHWRIRDEGQGEWYGKPRKWVHFGDDHHYRSPQLRSFIDFAVEAFGERHNRNGV